MPKHQFFLLILGILFLLLIPMGITGTPPQPGNGEDVHPESSPKTRVAVAFGLDLSQGNTEAFGLSANLDFSWMSKETEVVLSSSVNYLETDGEKKADKMAFQALLDHRLGDQFVFFILGKPSRNLVQEIDFRLETGLGFKYDIIDNYKNGLKDFLHTDLSVSLALIYEFTNRLLGEREKLCRASLRPKFKQELSKSLGLELEFFYQPDIKDFSNFRLLLESRVQFRVSKTISFLLRFIGEYNSVVPEDVKKQDYQLINQLVINL